jgi:large subunit ribosomal protein L23
MNNPINVTTLNVTMQPVQERLLQIILAPQVSEKSTFVGEKNNQYIFRVLQDATKPEIKAAVEWMFKVQVEGVQVANVKGKEKRFGRFMGRRRNWKKAYVSLAQGQAISFVAGETK